MREINFNFFYFFSVYSVILYGFVLKNDYGKCINDFFVIKWYWFEMNSLFIVYDFF